MRISRPPLKNSIALSIYLLVIFVFSGLQNSACAQESDIPPVYYAPNGSVFFKQSHTYSFYAAPVNSPVSNAFPVGAQRTGKTVQLSEGLNKIGVIGPDGKAQVQEINVDGTPPVSTLQFLKAPRTEANRILWFGKELQLDFAATDASSGVLQILFSVNEGGFSAFSAAVGGFTTNSAYEVTYYAVDNVGNRENPRKASFSVDVSGPDLSYELKGPRFQNYLGPDAEILVSAKDVGAGVDRILTRTSKKAYQLYRKAILADSLSDGSYVLQAYGIDKVNNSGDTLRFSFNVDKSAPTVTSVVEGAQVVRDGVVFIRSASRIKINTVDAGSGPSATRFVIDDRAEVEYRQPFSVSAETGAAVIEYYGEDRIGNVSDKKSLRVFVDETAPLTSFDFPGGYFKEGNDLIVSKNGQLTLEASDLESGVQRTEYRFSKGEWKAYGTPLVFDKTGAFSLEIRSIDMLGNVENAQTLSIKVQEKSSSASAEVSTKIDLTFKEEQGKLTGAGELPFYLWLSDKPDGTGMQFLLASPDSTKKKKGKPFLVESEGNLALTVSKPGQRVSFDIITDKTAPKTTLKPNNAPQFSSGDRLYFSNALEFQLSASDAISGVSGIMVSEDGGKFQIGKTSFKNFSSERQYSVRYFGVDKVGNAEKTSEFVFIIDATPPKTQHKILSNFAGNTLSPETVLELSAVDNLSGVANIKYRFDNTSEKVYAGTIKLSDVAGLADGPHVLYYRATDNVQNKEAERQFIFKFDSRKPELEPLVDGRTFTRENRIYVAPGAKMSFRNPDPRKELRQIWFTKNDGAQQTYSGPVLLDAPSSYSISFGAEDVLGNKTGVTKRIIIPDSRPPAISHSFGGVQIAAENGKLFLGSNSTLILSASDDEAGVRSVTYKIAGQGWKAYSGPAKLDATGTLEVSYQAIDQVGNLAEAKTFSVLNDLSAPSIDVTVTPLPANPGQLSTSSVIVLSAKDALTDVKGIVYRINDGEELPYVRPISNLPLGTLKMVITATDIVGNSVTETKTWSVK